LIIEKEKGNSFEDTTLPGAMEARGIKNLLITGLVTHQCVRATSLGALKLGYNVFLIQGGHSNFEVDAEKIIETQEAKLEEAGVHLVTPGQIDFV
jgi:nicotinamidase-related amidase